jgi:uncharacterized protein (TIGR00290 family)
VPTPVPVAFQWSGGKDSAHALGRLLIDDRYDVRTLVCTVHGPDRLSSVHEVPEQLLRAQAEAIGLPLRIVALADAGLGDYAGAMAEAADHWRSNDIRAVAFGDLDHSGALPHRQEVFGPAGLTVLEPLNGMTSAECMRRFLRSGIDAVTVVVDAAVLGRDHLGRPLDGAFLDALPAGCDPCGEYGEYHTFVRSAPYFQRAVRFTAGRPERLARTIGTTDGPQTFGYWRLRLR